MRSADADLAVKLARAWLAAGVPAVEVTLTVPEACAVLAAAASAARTGPALLGAGTVLTEDDVDRCVDAGAQFIVSPVTQPAVIRRAIERHVPVVAGVLTPSEIWTGHLLGAAALKIFPVDAVGGARYATSVLEPLPGLRLIASGGVTAAEVTGYLRAGFHGVALGAAELTDLSTLGTDDDEAMSTYTSSVLGRIS